MREDSRNGSISGQVAFASDDNNEHLVLLALKVIVPFAKLVKRLLIINGVAEDSDTGISKEEVSKVVDRSITSCIPNIELEFVLVDLDELSVVLNHIGSLLGLASLGTSLHEGADD